jgi:hypothetical protein
MITTRTKQYAIASAIFLVGSLGVAGFTYYKIDQLGAQLSSQVEVIEKNKLMQERYNELLGVMKRSENEHQALSHHLLTEAETINFLSGIEKLARNAKLQFTTDSLEVKPSANEPFQEIHLHLRAEGEQSDVLTFLKILETLPYYSYIDEMNLVERKNVMGENWVASINLIVALSAYDQ